MSVLRKLLGVTRRDIRRNIDINKRAHYAGTWNCQGYCSSYSVSQTYLLCARGSQFAWTTYMYVFHAWLCVGVQAVTDDQEDLGRSGLTIIRKTVSKWTYPYMKLRAWPTIDTNGDLWCITRAVSARRLGRRRQDIKEEVQEGLCSCKL